MTKNTIKLCIIDIVVLIIYNLAVFLIPFEYKSKVVFWASWGFGLAFILVQPLIAYFSLRGEKKLISKIYRLPIVLMGYSAMVLQLLFTTVMLWDGRFYEIPAWVVFVFEAILIGATIIGIILKDTYKDKIEKIEEETKIKISFISSLSDDSNLLINRVSDLDIKNKVTKFNEEVRYSDPVSVELSKEIEDEINRKYMVLKNDIINNNLDNISNQLDELLVLLNERNTIVKSNK